MWCTVGCDFFISRFKVKSALKSGRLFFSLDTFLPSFAKLRKFLMMLNSDKPMRFKNIYLLDRRKVGGGIPSHVTKKRAKTDILNYSHSKMSNKKIRANKNYNIFYCFSCLRYMYSVYNDEYIKLESI